MRSYDEAFVAARDERPFSNGTEGHGWMENWCYQCCQPIEKAWRESEAGEHPVESWFDGGCPLILVALMDRTPSEWLEQDGDYFGDQYHCIEFRGPDDGDGPEPQPVPEPPDMDGLFERPEPRTRMLVQPELVMVP